VAWKEVIQTFQSVVAPGFQEYADHTTSVQRGADARYLFSSCKVFSDRRLEEFLSNGRFVGRGRVGDESRS
jgi:hypothetical protein